MRRFNSYGPVDCEAHFCVGRDDLVNGCAEQLVGDPGKGGHYFTVWAPRQTGKTWLVQQVKKEIEKRLGDRFDVAMMSMQGVIMKQDDPPEAFLSRIPLLFQRFFKQSVEKPEDWETLGSLFSKSAGLFRNPLILFIDEFDKLPAPVIDNLASIFRDIYLDRDHFRLHSLALIGVRAVLGVESERGSPFNIQRSLHVPNFKPDEVTELFRQYQEESGQTVEPAVVQNVFEATRGQPGLVCWFGELLTETYNPGKDDPIDMDVWNETFRMACVKEWNNTVLNIVQKARGEHRDPILELFSRSDVPFSIDSEWRSYAYLNGIIDSETVEDSHGRKTEICRFANPFIQHRLYNAFMLDLIGDTSPILALEPFDRLTDVFDKPEIDVPALLKRYKGYLTRLKAAGLNPWKDQPRRRDLHIREAVGHFHLYFWLQQAVEDVCVVTPEFPTGNGRVDLRLQCGDQAGVIEVKSYKSQLMLEKAQTQAVRYAKRLNLSAITLAVFTPVDDEAVLAKLSGETMIGGTRVVVVAIGWV
ncbi:MAG: AAA-like domain-containing protein [Thermodesulfobacteriota bacterium]